MSDWRYGVFCVQQSITQQKKNIEKTLDNCELLWYYIGAVERPQKIMREWWNWQTR